MGSDEFCNRLRNAAVERQFRSGRSVIADGVAVDSTRSPRTAVVAGRTTVDVMQDRPGDGRVAIRRQPERGLGKVQQVHRQTVDLVDVLQEAAVRKRGALGDLGETAISAPSRATSQVRVTASRSSLSATMSIAVTASVSSSDRIGLTRQ